MKRRIFIRQCGAACAGMILLPAVLDSCSGVYYAVHEYHPTNLLLPLSEFEMPDGSMRHFVVVRNASLAFPIVVYRISEYEFIALHTECTHSSCEVRPYNTVLVCPCHGSEFSNTGKVLSAPAESDLKKFITRIENENLVVELS